MTTISVIIPAWCEAECIEQSVEGASRIGDEVIVADGGSPDDTAGIAASSGARVVIAPKGRGAQLRAGALAARGDVYLFLHADARLGPAARPAILSALQDPAIVGGNFLLAFEGERWFSRLFTAANDWRRRLFRVYYGDSALFVRRGVYERLGGFEPLPIFEDYEFIRRLEQSARGKTAYLREPRVYVSARRFERAPLATLGTWAALHALYSFANVHPTRLAALYHDVRRVRRHASARRGPASSS